MRNLNAKIVKIYVPKIIDDKNIKKSLENELFNISTALNDLYNSTDTSCIFTKTIPQSFTLSNTTSVDIVTLSIKSSENYNRLLKIELPYLYKTVLNSGETDTSIVIEVKKGSTIISSTFLNNVGFNPYYTNLPTVTAPINVGVQGDIVVSIKLKTSGTVDSVSFDSRTSVPKVIATLSSNSGDLS